MSQISPSVIPRNTPKRKPRASQVDRFQVAAQWQVPKWLPQPIVDYTRAIILGQDLDPALEHDVVLQTIQEAIQERPELLARLYQLTTDSRMKFVWRWLEKESRKVAAIPPVKANKTATLGEALLQVQKVATTSQDQVETFTPIAGDWLRGYLYRAIVADRDAAYWNSAPRAQKQHDMMLRISKLGQDLLELLNDPCNPYGFTPWDRLDAVVSSARNTPALDRKLLDELARKTIGHYWQRGESGGAELLQKAQGSEPFPVSGLPTRALLGHLPSQLKGLVMFANLSIANDGSKQNKPPSRTKHLRHTVYVRDLGRYVKSIGLRAKPFKDKQDGFPLHQIIAITTNVALNLSGSDEIPTDTVRKIIAKVR